MFVRSSHFNFLLRCDFQIPHQCNKTARTFPQSVLCLVATCKFDHCNDFGIFLTWPSSAEPCYGNLLRGKAESRGHFWKKSTWSQFLELTRLPTPQKPWGGTIGQGLRQRICLSRVLVKSPFSLDYFEKFFTKGFYLNLTILSCYFISWM